jgi:hypothetical protein
MNLKSPRILAVFLFLTATLAAAVVTPTPTPAPTPKPAPTITLADGHAYTAEELQDRITELVNERNSYVGQVIDLNTQVQKLQAQLSAAAVKPSK